MESYLKFLIEDIRLAHRKESEDPSACEDELEQHFREIETYVSGDAERKLGEYCGLDPEVFPAVERLSDNDVKRICIEFDAMLGSWNAEAVIPEEVPLSMKYDLLVNLLRKPFTPMSFGACVFDFCSGDPESCELKEYCPCLSL